MQAGNLIKRIPGAWELNGGNKHLEESCETNIGVFHLLPRAHHQGGDNENFNIANLMQPQIWSDMTVVFPN